MPSRRGRRNKTPPPAPDPGLHRAKRGLAPVPNPQPPPRQARRMMLFVLKVGLTGGLACGKSFVGDALAELGCQCCRRTAWGTKSCCMAGRLTRPWCANSGRASSPRTGPSTGVPWQARSLANLSVLNVLNSFVHPPVMRREERMAGRKSRHEIRTASRSWRRPS